MFWFIHQPGTADFVTHHSVSRTRGCSSHRGVRARSTRSNTNTRKMKGWKPQVEWQGKTRSLRHLLLWKESKDATNSLPQIPRSPPWQPHLSNEGAQWRSCEARLSTALISWGFCKSSKKPLRNEDEKPQMLKRIRRFFLEALSKSNHANLCPDASSLISFIKRAAAQTTSRLRASSQYLFCLVSMAQAEQWACSELDVIKVRGSHLSVTWVWLTAKWSFSINDNRYCNTSKYPTAMDRLLLRSCAPQMVVLPTSLCSWAFKS